MDVERMSLSHHGNIYRVCFWFRLVSSWYPVDGREPVQEGEGGGWEEREDGRRGRMGGEGGERRGRRGRRGRREERENENGRGWEKTDRRVGRRDTDSESPW